MEFLHDIMRYSSRNRQARSREMCTDPHPQNQNLIRINLLSITDSVIRSKYVCVKICPFLGHFSIMNLETILGREGSEGWW